MIYREATEYDIRVMHTAQIGCSDKSSKAKAQLLRLHHVVAPFY